MISVITSVDIGTGLKIEDNRVVVDTGILSGDFEEVEFENAETDEYYITAEEAYIQNKSSKAVYSVSKLVKKERAPSRPNVLTVTPTLVNANDPENTKVTTFANAEGFSDQVDIDLSINGGIKGVKGFNEAPEWMRTLEFTSPKVYSPEDGHPVLTPQHVKIVIPPQFYPTCIIKVEDGIKPQLAIESSGSDNIAAIDVHVSITDPSDLMHLKEFPVTFKVNKIGEGEVINREATAIINATSGHIRVSESSSIIREIGSGTFTFNVSCTGIDKEDYNWRLQVPAFDVTSNPQDLG